MKFHILKGFVQKASAKGRFVFSTHMNGSGLVVYKHKEQPRLVRINFHHKLSFAHGHFILTKQRGHFLVFGQSTLGHRYDFVNDYGGFNEVSLKIKYGPRHAPLRDHVIAAGDKPCKNIYEILSREYAELVKR